MKNHECILVDLDGTLAHHRDRSIYDLTKVDSDEIDEMVHRVIKGLAWDGVMIIILTGRDESCRGLTERWLQQHAVGYHALFMRAAGDKRSDVTIKTEIFQKHIEPNFCVKSVFEDRPKVCRAWRDIGLQVFQLGDPHHEF
jgi:hypothetical protein